jgi:hypothetical protein
MPLDSRRAKFTCESGESLCEIGNPLSCKSGFTCVPAANPDATLLCVPQLIEI